MLHLESVPTRSSVRSGPFEAEARVRGSMPSWLKGRLVRTAPAIFAEDAWQARHWFDALGMLYAFEIGDDGSVAWHQRLLESDTARAAARGRVPFAQFGTPNGRSALRRLMQPVPRSTDNANVSILPFGDDWLAMSETDRQLLVDPITLRVRAHASYDDALPSSMWMTAHPQLDARRQSLVNVGTAVGARTALVVYEQTLGKMQRREIGRWSPQRLPYVHSFGLCDSTAVLIGHPFDVSPTAFLWSNDFVEHYRWRPEGGTRLVAIDRASGHVTEYEAPPLFVFHTVNTFCEGDDLVVDVLAYADARVLTTEMRVDAMRERCPDLRARFTRLRVPRRGGTVSVEHLGEAGFEFPVIDRSKAHGSRQRWVWGAEVAPGSSGVVAVDLEQGEVRRHRRDGLVFGEPVFVGRPGAAVEGDGVLLTVGTSAVEARTELHVLDARTLELVAQAAIPAATPLGFHGAFQRARA